MTLYRYVALDSDGKERLGLLDAESMESAKERLRSKRIMVTKIVQALDQKEITLNSNLLIAFTRDLSQLLRSKLPLYESLVTIEEKFSSHKKHFLFLDICDKVRQGKKLSEAFASYPKIFDEVYVSMVAAGENTGQLDVVFFQLYKVIARSDKLQKQTKAALVYPSFLLAFCLVILAGLFLYLIPSMKELFEGRALHPMTKMVVGMSDWMQANWMGLLGGVVGVALAGVYISREKKARNWIKVSLTKIPMFREVFTEAVLMRFCRVLSILLSSGVTLVEALKYAKGVIHHPDFEKVISKAEEGIVKGSKFSQELKKSPLIPSLVVRMIETSEETGSSSEMLLSIGEIYEEKLEKTISQFTNLLQPVMLLVLGLLVGLVLLSVLLPLTDMSSLM